MPTLETERLILRDFVLSDWEALNSFLSDPAVTRFMHFASCARVMQKCGMEYEGMFYDADFAGNWAIRYRYKIMK